MENETKTTAVASTDAKDMAEETKTGDIANPETAPTGTPAAQSAHTADNLENSVSGTEHGEAKDGTDRTEMRKEFENLIKGDYKEFYEERVKENLNRRFRETAQKRQRNEDNSRIAQMLYERYNVADGDAEALMDAIESDNAYLAAEADKRGMSIEDYKYIMRLERENRSFYRMRAEQEAADRANMAVRHWYDEGQSLKESYPEFDIFSEAKNPSFVSLLQNGIDVKTAYEVVHHAELVSKAAQEAAKEAEKRTAEAIRQRAQRPAENGLSSASSAIIKNNVSSLSAKEREEIARRAARGERITF